MFLRFKLPNGTVIERSVAKSSVTIGRSNKADFIVPDESLSRIHCLIEIEEDNFFITDMNSANGVFIDGERIDPNQKTPFSTFMQLTLGALEFSVQDEHELSQKNNLSAIPLSKSSPGPSRAANTPRLSSATPRLTAQTKNKSTSNMMLLTLGGLIVLGMAFYLHNNSAVDETNFESNEESFHTSPPSKKQVLKFQTSAEFASMALYQNLISKKTCSGQEELCKEFLLEETEDEGVVFEGKEVYVFMKPNSLYDIPQLKFLDGTPGGEELISHYMVLKSSLMDKIYSREREQIHLLMLNNDKKVVKIFRYHGRQFNETNQDRYNYLEQINMAIINQDLTNISPVLEKAIPSKEFIPE